MTTATPRRRRRARRAGLLVAALAGAGIAVPALSGQQSAAAATLTPFADCAQLDAWFTAAALDRVNAWGLNPSAAGDTGGFWGRLLGGGDSRTAQEAGSGVADSAGAAPAPAVPELNSTGSAVGVGGTGTNLQEAGVDEPDLVKTDGRRVVTVTGERLHVLGVDGDRLAELGSLRLPDQWTSELLLLGDRALVVGQRDVAIPLPEPLPDGPGEGRVLPEPLPGGEDGEDGEDGDAEPVPAPPGLLPVPGPPGTVLTVVDLSDPGSPTVVRTQEIEAGYLSARASGGAVRVVLASTPSLPFVQPDVGPTGEVDAGAAHAANRQAVEEAGGADWLPHSVTRDAQGSVVERAPLLECAAVSHPSEDSGLGMLTVLTLDAGTDDLAVTGSTAVAADGSLVYASTDRLYVATTGGGWGMPMPVDGISQGVLDASTDDAGPQTQLHGFDTGDAADTEYVASGSVPGWLLGRWAMSAHDGMLRVATTTDGARSPDGVAPGTEAVVTVLDEQGEALVPVGSVGGLGKGEQIRAVRWFDDLAVVVTFRQTDPLYTVDLANPTAPGVVGELKIPGYSAYLHPLGEGLLLGVGQDATQTGQTTGTQVSTFDLRDLAAPGRLDTLTYRDTWSDVEADSRAFSYLPDRRLALLPISGPNGAGVVAVSVGADGALDEAGNWSPEGLGSFVQRATPVGADRVVVLGEDSGGRSVTLLQAPELAELDRVRLD